MLACRRGRGRARSIVLWAWQVGWKASEESRAESGVGQLSSIVRVFVLLRSCAHRKHPYDPPESEET